MPTLRLTDAAIKRLRKPEAGRIEYWDSHTRGFGLRLSVTGVQSWVVITRSLQAGAWKQQRVTLGTYPAMSLAQARKKASEAISAAKSGEDPASAVKAERAALVNNSRNTFGIVRAEFLEKYRGRQNRRPAANTLKEMTRVLSASAFDAWADTALAKINRRDILDVLDGIVDRGAETMANRTLAYLKLLFGWAAHRGIIDGDPTVGIKKPGAERSRDRVLSVDELRAIWKATESNHTQFNAIVRLLMLTGARLREVAELAWREVDCETRTWTLPAARVKNHREHMVPLSAAALGVLDARKAVQNALATADKPVPKLAFTSNHTTPFSGFSRAKSLLDKRIAKTNPDMEPWRLHDIRRSVATHMAETLRIPPHVIEAALNHVSGTKAGVAGVYNRALHLDERRAALDAWADYLRRMVGETDAKNVVELTPKRAAS